MKQAGLSLIELMIAMALGSLLVLGISRYAIDALQSQQSVTELADIQDSARIAMEKIRTEIQRAGYQGCNNATLNVYSHVPNAAWNKRIKFLREEGVEIKNNTLSTATLVPLLSESASLIVSPDRKTITIAADPNTSITFPHRVNTGDYRLFLGSCRVMDFINPPTIVGGTTSFSLVNPVSDKLVEAGTNTFIPSVRLYEYRENHLELAAAGGNASLRQYETNPQNAVPFVEGLEVFGTAINEAVVGTRVYNISLNFLDALRNDVAGPAPNGQAEPGLYTSRVTARNAGRE